MIIFHDVHVAELQLVLHHTIALVHSNVLYCLCGDAVAKCHKLS